MSDASENRRMALIALTLLEDHHAVDVILAWIGDDQVLLEQLADALDTAREVV